VCEVNGAHPRGLLGLGDLRAKKGCGHV
jgi:hypothetical protein